MDEINKWLNKRFNKLTIIKFSHRHSTRFEKYYICRCDCGNIKTITLNALRYNNTKSCGCYRRSFIRQNQLPQGEASFNSLLSVYKKQAKKRNLEFSLSIQQFKEFISKNCHYCNTKPNTIHRKNGTNGSYIYNGIDRKNNKIGYILNNCVTCCYDCNSFKRGKSYDEFLNRINIIYNNIKNY